MLIFTDFYLYQFWSDNMLLYASIYLFLILSNSNVLLEVKKKD